MLLAQPLDETRFEQFGEGRRNVGQFGVGKRVDLEKSTPPGGEAHEQALGLFGQKVKGVHKVPLGVDEDFAVEFLDKIQDVAVVVEVVLWGKVGGGGQF